MIKLILVRSLYRADVLQTNGKIGFLEKSEETYRRPPLKWPQIFKARKPLDFSINPILQKFSRTSAHIYIYINILPVSDFSLEILTINWKLVVKYNLLIYAENEEKSKV